jgi:hypothetical protein
MGKRPSLNDEEELPPKREKISLEEMRLILPAGYQPPSDEEVAQILEEERWKRLNRLRSMSVRQSLE